MTSTNSGIPPRRPPMPMTNSSRTVVREPSGERRHSQIRSTSSEGTRSGRNITPRGVMAADQVPSDHRAEDIVISSMAMGSPLRGVLGVWCRATSLRLILSQMNRW